MVWRFPSWCSCPCQESRVFSCFFCFSPARYLCSFFVLSVQKCSLPVILAYPPPPGPPSFFCCTLNYTVVDNKTRMQRWSDWKRNRTTGPVLDSASSCVVWVRLYEAWIHMQGNCTFNQTSLWPFYYQSRKCVWFGRQSYTRQDMRWQRWGSSTSRPVLTLYLCENNNMLSVLWATGRASIHSWIMVNTHGPNETEVRRGQGPLPRRERSYNNKHTAETELI